MTSSDKYKHHETPVPYAVTVPVTINVEANSRAEAESLAAAFIEADLPGATVDETRFRAKKHWLAVAHGLLVGGASYNQTALSIGIDRATIKKRIPGFGWTAREGVEYRDAKQTLDSL